MENFSSFLWFGNLALNSASKNVHKDHIGIFILYIKLYLSWCCGKRINLCKYKRRIWNWLNFWKIM